MNHRNPEAKAVRMALHLKGKTVRRWAKDHKHAYRTVLNAIELHAGGHAREPWGQKTIAILRDLSREIGRPILPGILEK